MYWEKRKKVEETKLSTYLSWMPFLADCYYHAFYPDGGAFDEKAYLKKQVEILGTLQIMGPTGAIDAFYDFCDEAERAMHKDASFNRKKFHESYTQLNYCFCCDIHGEKFVPAPQKK